MFIATCNVLDSIPSALKDRMEVIQLSGYTEEEKFFIAKKYLIPKQTNENGIKDTQIEFDDESVKTIISQYTREAGLRNLERSIATVCRKTARFVAEGKTEKIINVWNRRICWKKAGDPNLDRRVKAARI